MNLAILTHAGAGAQFLGASGVAFFILIIWWLILFFAVPRSTYYEMDPKGRSFEPSIARYFDVAKVVISLAVGSVALVAGYVGFVIQRQPGQIASVQRAVAWPLPFFAFSIIYAVFFLASLARSYETYLHFPQSYTRFWYSLNQSLGFAGLTCFALGYFLLAWSVVAIRLEGK